MTETAARFAELHHGPAPLLLANAWDEGSARLFASLGFRALATTSSGYAATLGRSDYGVSREEAISHAAALARATPLPLSADLEDCFATDAAGVAETIAMAAEAGLAGCSIEDWSARDGGRLFDHDEARERVQAAADAAAGRRLVLTARAENFLRGRPDLPDTIARLQSYQEAGADVLYAPGLSRAEDIASVVRSLDRPVNVLARLGAPPVAELSGLGVKRISVGGSFAFAALAAAADAARELLEQGTYGFAELAARGAGEARAAFAR